jgi:dihydroorotate dehydrogenase electron transfer subunit
MRRALSLHRIAREDGAIGLLFGHGKTWSDWLAKRRPGDQIDLIGPLGRGFVRDRAARHLLLVAEGLGIAPLVALAEEALNAGCSVTLVIDAPSAAQLFPLDRLPTEIEVMALTADGSAGRKGRAIDGLAELLPWADQVALAGSNRLLDEARAILKRNGSRKAVQAIVEERMACGVGACLGCVVFTHDGPQTACVAGPVFDLWRLAA